jgi:hypothetical protein
MMDNGYEASRKNSNCEENEVTLVSITVINKITISNSQLSL